jgi:hypothetical protein
LLRLRSLLHFPRRSEGGGEELEKEENRKDRNNLKFGRYWKKKKFRGKIPRTGKRNQRKGREKK